MARDFPGSSRSAPADLRAGEQDALHRLGQAFLARGYEERSLASLLGLPALAAFRWQDTALYERRIAAGLDLGTLARLFLMMEARPVDPVRAALGADAIETLLDVGLAREDAGWFIPASRITPFAGLLFAHDPDHGLPPGTDHVPGIGPASRTLAALTVRRPVASALDVGVGCGIQALLAARHAARVVGVDVNPRALAYAGINAGLNGIAHLELCQGSLLDPVRGEAFDLVVANPPFVLSPDRAYTFRDAGDDNISEALLRSLPTVMAAGGYATSLISWPMADADDWQAEPRSWVEDQPIDGWLLCHGIDDPLTYAARWNVWLQMHAPADYGHALDRWRAYFANRAVVRIGTGAMVLHRRGDGVGPGSWGADRMLAGPGAAASAQIERLMTSRAKRETMEDDEALLRSIVHLHGPHRLDQTLRFAGGAYQIQGAQVVMEDGVKVPVAVPAEVLPVLLTLDGAQPLQEVIDLAGDGLPGEERADLTRAALGCVRRLLAVGIASMTEAAPAVPSA